MAEFGMHPNTYSICSQNDDILYSLTLILCSTVGFLFKILDISPTKFKYNKLGSYDVGNNNDLTVSGFSSGGAMATQFHFINSATCKSAGIFAGLPYTCCPYGPLSALSCTLFGPSSLEILKMRIEELATKNKIDSPQNITNQNIYVTAGNKDIIVTPMNSDTISNMYKMHGAKNWTYFIPQNNHGIPCNNALGEPCSLLSPNTAYINNCNYSGVETMIKYIYPEYFSAIVKEPNGKDSFTGDLKTFDQTEFVDCNFYLSGLAESGFIYVPKNCKNGTTKCKLHIAFHGCLQNQATVGDAFVKNAGYLEMADACGLIILFPQTANTCVNYLTACWDFFGYTGSPTYATKEGVQNKAVLKMIQRICGK